MKQNKPLFHTKRATQQLVEENAMWVVHGTQLLKLAKSRKHRLEVLVVEKVPLCPMWAALVLASDLLHALVVSIHNLRTGVVQQDRYSQGIATKVGRQPNVITLDKSRFTSPQSSTVSRVEPRIPHFDDVIHLQSLALDKGVNVT